MRAPAALLATTSAAGLLLARAMDGLGLLPGVTESAAVRAAAVDPRWTALGLLGCLALGELAGRLLRRAPLLAVAVLVGGQLGLVVLLEELAREVSGAPEGGGESGLVVAAAAQLVLAVLAVTTALLVLRLAPPLHQALRVQPLVRGPLPPYRLVLTRAPQGRPRGRAPPSAT
ncbi:MAG TPA: hypothetical protein VMZ11_00160 [Mycobacteriales bacterium]|nr:hypothetical protein [Mycobacteriales bacterium]